MKPRWWQSPKLVKLAIGVLQCHYQGTPNYSPKVNEWLIQGQWLNPDLTLTPRGMEYMKEVYNER